MMFLSVSKFPGLFSRAVAKRPMVGQTGIMLCAHAMATILVPPSVGPTRRHSHGRGRTARISHVNRTIRTTMERYPLWTRSCVDPSPVQEFEIQSKNLKNSQRNSNSSKEFQILSKHLLLSSRYIKAKIWDVAARLGCNTSGHRRTHAEDQEASPSHNNHTNIHMLAPLEL